MADLPSSHKIELFANKPELFYIKRFRKKKGKGVRVIHAPSPELKQLQREFADWFYSKKKGEFEHEHQITGFMPGKSIADNALPHLNKDWVINLDIKDFFPSTTFDQVVNAVRTLPRSKHPLDWLKKNKPIAFKRMQPIDLKDLLTLDGGLPQGSPASPMIANYIGMKMVDPKVRSVLIAYLGSIEGSFGFTRYADDITVSFNGGSREVAKSIAYEISHMVNKCTSYKIKEEKTVIKHRSQRQLVTGVLVNGGNTRIDRRLMNKMRAIIHNSRRDGEEFDAETKGMLSFIQSINKEQYNKLIN